MEILFLYISEHPVIADANINFGGSHIFTYHTLIKTLEIKENPFYIIDFFAVPNEETKEISKISNITGIVGENGAGKSSLLNYIKEVLSRGYTSIKERIILAVRDGDKIIIYYSPSLIEKHNHNQRHNVEIIYHPLKIEEQTINLPGFKEPVTYQDFPEIEVLQNLDFVYFSNVFDNTLETELDGLFNISTNFLSLNDYKKNQENLRLSSDTNILEEFRYEEIRRQLEFINHFDYKNVIQFKLPEYLVLNLKRNYSPDNFSIKERGFIENNSFRQLYDISYQKGQAAILNAKKADEKFKLRVILASFLNIIIELSTTYSSFARFILVETSNSSKSKRSLVNYIKSILNEFLKSGLPNGKIEVELGPFHEKFNGLLKFIDIMVDLPLQPSLIGDNEGNSIVFYINTKETENSFLSFYKNYKLSFFLSPYLNFTWRNLSSGERALFSIYSRFFSLTNDQLKGVSSILKQNVVILLDEPDVYLHPAWQKKLVETLSSYLSIIFKKTPEGKNRNIQIVFTTNNPLTISDLPHTNIIFLKKDNDKTVIQSSLDDKKMTFAANIFNLFADSFFLKGGFTGSFAVAKINSAIDEINSPEPLSNERKEVIRKIIQMIGEPLLKNKLAEMLHTKERISNNYDDRLNKLEQEVFRNDKNQKG